MNLEGGCYCGALRYEVSSDPMFQGQCHCRECQYISGGQPNVIMAIPGTGFAYTKGTPNQFKRSDLENPVVREFCGDCGTHIVAKPPALGGAVVLKVGTLDDQSSFAPQMAIYLCDKQSYHHVPEGIATFDKTPS